MRTPAMRATAPLSLALGAALLLAGSPSPVLAEGGKEAAPPATAYKEQFRDEVLLRGARSPLTGVEVLVEGYDKVDWKGKTGGTQTRPAGEVVHVKLGDEPTPFTRGMEAFRGGRWAEAEAEFRGTASAVQAGRARRLWEARADLYVGECRRRLAAREKSSAKFEEAALKYRDGLAKDPKSPLADMGWLGLAEAQAGSGGWDDAFKSLDELRKVGAEGGRPVWEGRSRLSRGRLLERKGEVGGAASEFLDLAKFAEAAIGRAAPESADRKALEGLRVDGLVAHGWALYAKAEKTKSAADVDAARKYFESLPTSTGGSTAGKAASANGIGGILLLEGKALQALERFVEVEVTMFSVPGEVARALWQKAQAWDKLGNPAAREQALKDLAEFHPGSEWAGRTR